MTYDEAIYQMNWLADTLEHCSETAKTLGWGVAASTMLKAASSIRWNIRWEQKHPDMRAKL